MKYVSFAKPLLLPEVIFTAGALYYLPSVSSGGGFLKAVGAVILSVDGVPIQKSKAAVVVGKSVYILPGEHRLEMAGYTLRHQLSNIPSFPSKGKQQERTVRFTGGRRYILRYEPAGRKLEISDNGPI